MSYSLLFANGDLVEAELPWLRQTAVNAARLIAIDGGGRHLARLGLLPDRLLGDLDSLPADIRIAWQERALPTVAYPTDKDATDLELALRDTLTHWPADPIWVVAAFGGRWDHTFANFLLLAHPDLRHANITLVSPHQRAWVSFAERSSLSLQLGKMLSLLPLTPTVTVTLQGCAWELSATELSLGSSRTLSNRITAPVATLTVADGGVGVVQWD